MLQLLVIIAVAMFVLCSAAVADSGINETPSETSAVYLPESALETKAISPTEKSAAAIRQCGLLIKSGKLSEAESLWDSEVLSERGSANWHLERCGVIMESVFWAKENGDSALASTMARKAFAELVKAEAKIDKTDPIQAPILESILDLKGFLEQHFVGDTNSAKREHAKRDAIRADIKAQRAKAQLNEGVPQ